MDAAVFDSSKTENVDEPVMVCAVEPSKVTVSPLLYVYVPELVQSPAIFIRPPEEVNVPVFVKLLSKSIES